jgi:hypothetical protein
MRKTKKKVNSSQDGDGLYRMIKPQGREKNKGKEEEKETGVLSLLAPQEEVQLPYSDPPRRHRDHLLVDLEFRPII